MSADRWSIYGQEVLIVASHGSNSFYGLIVLLALVAGALRYFFGPGRVSVSKRHRDPQRWFTHDQKREILRRSGHRCEATYLGRRCAHTTDLQADHVIPWAAGGPTTVANGQALCRTCNREKSNRVPSSRQVRKLDERRTHY
ncbi:MAG TPA: HNH endonuclease signature motif containing protein [Marmoricola sp.]|nr:HNH endonuclease signature motif containing protein [Marmoricola sp.]